MAPHANGAFRQPQSCADGPRIQTVRECELQEFAVGVTELCQRATRVLGALPRHELRQRVWIGGVFVRACAQHAQRPRLAPGVSKVLLADVAGGLEEKPWKRLRVDDLAVRQRLHRAPKGFLSDILRQPAIPKTAKGK